MIMQGTLANITAVIIGSTVGLAIHRKLPEKLSQAAFNAIGIFTLFIGVSMASKSTNILILIFSIVSGSILGELLSLHTHLEHFSEKIKKKYKSKSHTFTEGFVTAFLLFCMGSMTILGSIEDGLGNTPHLLYAKSVLDLFASIALAASLGIGVVFSIIPLFLYQGSLTLLASYFKQVVTEGLINEMSASGGLILIGLGLDILDIKKIKTINMLPSLIISIILATLFI